MTKNFNVARYQELVELKKNGKISSLDRELLAYLVSIEDQISYNQKEKYFSLIEQYLSRVIAPHEFRLKFSEMENQDSRTAGLILKDFQQLEVFTLTDDLKEFSDLISEISTLCLEYGDVWDDTMEPMSESEFYSLINRIHSQFQKVFPSNFLEISCKNQKYKHLVSRSFNFLIFSIGLVILFILFSINTIKY